MTTLLSPVAGGSPESVLDAALRHDLYPPDFADITRAALREVLDRDHPGVTIDIDRTWLFCRDKRLPANTPMPPAVYTLIESVIELFTGGLNWTKAEPLGLFNSAAPGPLAVEIHGLSPAALLILFAETRQILEARYTQAIDAYWDTSQPNGKTRRISFVEQRVQTLKLECQRRVEEGEMDSALYWMLEAALKSSGFGDGQPATVKAHGVYGLALIAGSAVPMDLCGGFVLTAVSSNIPADSDNQSLGAALLYTPHAGVEGFDSLRRLTESLNQRLLAPGKRLELLAALEHNAREQLDAQSPGTQSRWQYTPLNGDFMDLSFARQITQQKADFGHAVKLARSLEMDHRSFEQLLLRLLKARAHFDNHKHLEQHDAALIQANLPNWWQSMNVDQRRQWLALAQQSGAQAVELHRSSVAHFHAEESNPETFVSRYLDSTLDAALEKHGITLAAERINVTLWFDSGITRVGFALSPHGQPPEFTQFSLRALVHERAETLRLNRASAITVTDDSGAVLEKLTPEFVRTLLAHIDAPKAFDDFLTLQLKNSPYALQLRKGQEALMLAQLRMALLQSEQDPSFPVTGRQWLAAVIDAPDPAKRKTVGADRIEVRFLQVHNTRLANLLLIVPAGKLESGPVLLCTFGAPDGVVLRWFNSLFHLKAAFLEQEKFRPYLAQQISAVHRPTTLGILEYDKWLKHWRLPDAMRYMTQPLPIPAVVFRPVTFVAQTRDFLQESHDIKIEHLIVEAQARLADIGSTGQSNTLELLANIALLFLPPPVALPLALGAAFYEAWSGFRKFDADDLEGATQEFTDALGYVAAAGAGVLLKAQEPAALLEDAPRPPHLVRTVGRDGQRQIGYLLSPAAAPHFPDAGMRVAMDPTRFLTILLDDEPCYVRRRFNLFGHSRLYRLNAQGGNLLVHADEYVVHTRAGAWALAGGHAAPLTRAAQRAAKAALDALVDNWPMNEAMIDEAEKAQFVTRYRQLSDASNSEGLPEIAAYSEGGSATINRTLRSGSRSAQTDQFLTQFYQLHEQRQVAFRATHVSQAGLERLEQQIGGVFADPGVQSASLNRINATRWSKDSFVTQNATTGNHPAFFIFDGSIAKRNMFTGFLGDHVGIAPATRLQLQAMRHSQGYVFAYFATPQHIAREVYDLYSGEKELMV